MPSIETRDVIDIAIGGRIRTRRITLRLTQSALAAKLACSNKLVSHWEIGTVGVTAAWLVKLSDALEVGAAYFLAGIDHDLDGTLLATMDHRDALELATLIIALPEANRTALTRFARAAQTLTALPA